jgi:hypothetical protein
MRARASEDGRDKEDKDANLAARQRTALDLLGCGYGLDHIMSVCGFKSRSTARRALDAARRAIAEDTAEEHRLNFKASYGPIRQAMHRRARMGDVRAVEALVKLDERECRLFGLDISPEDASLHVQYTKRIVLEETVALLPVPSISAPEHSENGSTA